MNYSVIETIKFAFVDLWADVISFLPQIVLAIIVLIVGSFIGSSLRHAVRVIFAKLKVNEALGAAGVTSLAERTGYRFDAGLFVGTLVKWFVIIVFFIVALDLLKLSEVVTYLRDVVLNYLPNVIAAVLILLVASIVAGFAKKSVIAAFTAANIRHPEFFGKVAHGAILFAAVLATLNQLKIAPELVQTLFMGVVFAFSLALGLAFGLGGKDAATRFIDARTKD